MNQIVENNTKHIREAIRNNNKRINEKQDKKEIQQIFKEIWDGREDEQGNCYCFETGRTLHGYTYRNSTNCYHHVLEQGKTKYPEYAKTKRNIIIIHPDVHLDVHQDIDKCPNIKKYKEFLLSLHYKNEL